MTSEVKTEARSGLTTRLGPVFEAVIEPIEAVLVRKSYLRLDKTQV